MYVLWKKFQNFSKPKVLFLSIGSVAKDTSFSMRNKICFQISLKFTWKIVSFFTRNSYFLLFEWIILIFLQFCDMFALLFKFEKSFITSNKFWPSNLCETFTGDFEFLMIHALMLKLYCPYKVGRVGPWNPIQHPSFWKTT